MSEAKLAPPSHPSTGIPAWNPPKSAPTMRAYLARSSRTVAPPLIATANASIARPTAMRRVVANSISPVGTGRDTG